MKNEIKGTDIASRLIFISMAMTVIQQDIIHIQNGPFKIKEPYIDQLERMHTTASNECRDLKKEMWDKRISFVLMGRRKGSTEYKFIVNGKERTRAYNNHIIKKNVKEILEELMKKSSFKQPL